MAGLGRYQPLGDHSGARKKRISLKFWIILANIIVITLILINYQAIGQQLSALTGPSSPTDVVDPATAPTDSNASDESDDELSEPPKHGSNNGKVNGHEDNKENNNDGTDASKGKPDNETGKTGQDGANDANKDNKGDGKQDIKPPNDSVKGNKDGESSPNNGAEKAGKEGTKPSDGSEKNVGSNKGNQNDDGKNKKPTGDSGNTDTKPSGNGATEGSKGDGKDGNKGNKDSGKGKGGYPKAGVKVWNPPDMISLVHGMLADPKKHKPSYTNAKFPDSPMLEEPDEQGKERPWLGAVICSPWDVERRMLIRYTWMDMFKDVPMDKKFVIANPTRDYREIIQRENRTFGDIIVLEKIEENDFTANTVKTIEFYRWLSEKSPRKYEFVSKMDTDLFVNAKGMWDRKIFPRLAPAPIHSRDETSDGTEQKALKATVDNTVIASIYWDGYHHSSFPHGALYTVTWDLVELLPKLQDKYHIIAGEDVTMAWLLMKARKTVNFVYLNHTEKFEYDWRDTRPQERTAWAQKASNPASIRHAVYGNDVLGIHQLKDNEQWFLVANCFDKNGIKKGPDPKTEKPHGKDDEQPWFESPWHEHIPKSYYEVYDDGSFLVNGLWHLEKGMNEKFEWVDGKAHLRL